MEIKFTFRLEPPRSWVRASVFAGALVAVLGTGVALVRADLPLTTFTAGTPISHTDVNNNFSTLAAAVTALQMQISVLEANDHVQRANIDPTGAITPAGTSWLTVNYLYPGGYRIFFAPEVFSTTPTCVATATAGNASPPIVECFGASSNGITCQASDAANSMMMIGIFLVCIGS